MSNKVNIPNYPTNHLDNCSNCRATCNTWQMHEVLTLRKPNRLCNDKEVLQAKSAHQCHFNVAKNNISLNFKTYHSTIPVVCLRMSQLVLPWCKQRARKGCTYRCIHQSLVDLDLEFCRC